MLARSVVVVEDVVAEGEEEDVDGEDVAAREVVQEKDEEDMLVLWPILQRESLVIEETGNSGCWMGYFSGSQKCSRADPNSKGDWHEFSEIPYEIDKSCFVSGKKGKRRWVGTSHLVEGNDFFLHSGVEWNGVEWNEKENSLHFIQCCYCHPPSN